jgi:hypothetical protein
MNIAQIHAAKYTPVTSAVIAASYTDAMKLTSHARYQAIHVTAIWEKVTRIHEYLDRNATAELADALQ